MKLMHWQSLAFCAALLLLCAACTPATITPDKSLPPPTNVAQNFRNVALGPVDARQQEFAYLVPFFREGFVRRLNELKGFDFVSDNASTPPSPGTLVVTGTLTEVDKGDAALRFLIGMGAGGEHATVHLVTKSPDGTTLGAFDVRKTYLGGIGIGGISFVDIEDLVTQLGEQSAQSLVDWSKGQLNASN